MCHVTFGYLISDELCGGFNGRPHVQWPTRPQYNGYLEAPRIVAL